MKDHLVELERKALAEKSNGELSKAAVLYSRIVEQRPDYEHGMAYYNLAGCYEDLGEIGKARESYERALEYGRDDPIILGGYASFLFLYGEPEEAFENFLELIALEKNASNQTATETIKIALHELGRKIGMSEQMVDTRIRSVLAL